MGHKQEQYRINAVINSMEITMENSAGASASIINYDRYLKLSRKSGVSLVDRNVMLRMCSGNVMKTRSKFEGVFEYVGEKMNHYFVALDEARPSLLGRDILNLIFGNMPAIDGQWRSSCIVEFN